MIRLLCATMLVVGVLLAGCTSTPTSQELSGAGGASPQAVVESFLEDLNQALAAPDLADPAARRVWAERLASHFAPSERADQRIAMATMLAKFADSMASPAIGSRATLELTFSGTEVINQDEGRALVRIIDGLIVLRFLDANGEVLRERSAGISEVIGQLSGGLPVLQVGTSWYITEG